MTDMTVVGVPRRRIKRPVLSELWLRFRVWRSRAKPSEHHPIAKAAARIMVILAINFVLYGFAFNHGSLWHGVVLFLVSMLCGFWVLVIHDDELAIYKARKKP